MANRGSNWYHGKGGARWLTVPGGRMPSMSNKFGINMRTIVLKNAVRGLTNQILKMQMATVAGVNAAADYLKEQTENVPPTTPKDKGDLRKSFFKRVTEVPNGIQLEVGYSAPYALYVHEMTSPPYGLVQWTEPGSGPKWFEIHIQKDKKMMLAYIRAYAEGSLK